MYSANYCCHFLEFHELKFWHKIKRMTFYVNNNFLVIFSSKKTGKSIIVSYFQIDLSLYSNIQKVREIKEKLEPLTPECTK